MAKKKSALIFVARNKREADKFAKRMDVASDYPFTRNKNTFSFPIGNRVTEDEMMDILDPSYDSEMRDIKGEWK